MYIDFKKFIEALSYVVGVVVLLYGALTFALSMTSQDQIAGTLAAIFGLHLLWFLIWLKRSTFHAERASDSKPIAVIEQSERRQHASRIPKLQ